MKFRLNKVSFTLGNLFGAAVVALVIVTCGGGRDAGTMPASNIILANAAQSARISGGLIRVQANQLPSNVQVLASNVSIDPGTNDLTSTNLQSALDTEMAVDVGKIIVGTWNIVNSTDDDAYQGAASTGTVTFNSDGSYVITGGFAAAGQGGIYPIADGPVAGPCIVPNALTFNLTSKGTIFFGARLGANQKSLDQYHIAFARSAVAFIVASKIDSNTNELTLAGLGGNCGETSLFRISKLTRATGGQNAAFSPRNRKPTLPVLLTSLR